MFSHIKPAPLDPILGTNILFNKDTDPRKVLSHLLVRSLFRFVAHAHALLQINLGIGAYRTDEGKPLVLNCVKKAEKLAVCV